jgi:16S rRNA (guanine(1405)-N(7))-methyltransferase
MNPADLDMQALLARVMDSSKYRSSGLNPDTVLDLIRQEVPHQPSEKAVYKIVRRKLHNIIAPYLGEPNYPALSERLSVMGHPRLDSPELQDLALTVLREHASTAERIPYQTDLYKQLFTVTGKPTSILDLACALHPLAFPWMGLPVSTQYHAYDIVQPRVDFINHFFSTLGMEPLAENRDILVNPPEIRADLGIFFKEAHRFEKRQPGCNRAFWASLKVDTLAISLPTQNLAGTHSLLDQHRSLVYENLPGGSNVEELIFKDEIIFVVKHWRGTAR